MVEGSLPEGFAGTIVSLHDRTVLPSLALSCVFSVLGIIAEYYRHIFPNQNVIPGLFHFSEKLQGPCWAKFPAPHCRQNKVERQPVPLTHLCSLGSCPEVGMGDRVLGCFFVWWCCVLHV